MRTLERGRAEDLNMNIIMAVGYLTNDNTKMAVNSQRLKTRCYLLSHLCTIDHLRSSSNIRHVSFALVAFNFLSCYGWLSVLYQTVDHLIITNGEYQSIYKQVSQLLQVVQTVAVLEILHSLIGIVKAAPFPTMMQVASRLYIVWLVLYAYPFQEVTTASSSDYA